MELSDILENISSEKFSEVAEALDLLSLDELLELFNLASDDNKVRIIRLLKPPRAVELISNLDENVASSTLKNLTDPEITYFLEQLDPGVAVKILEFFETELFERILLNLEPRLKTEILLILGYPEDSVGRFIEFNFVSARDDETVDSVIEKVRTSKLDPEEIDAVYLVDFSGKFAGVVYLPHLIKADPYRPVGNLAQDTVTVQVTDKVQDVIEKISETSLNAIPALDSNSKFIGVVRASNLLEIAGDIQAERITAFGGAVNVDNLDYRTNSVLEIFKSRFVWLAILVIFGALVSGYIQAQEEVLARAVILAAFIPPIVDMGGNAGSQAASYMIRALGTGEIPAYGRVLLALLKKDILVALLLGVCLGALEGFITMIFKDVSFEIMLAVVISMISVTVVGSFIGFILPFLAFKARLDPAVLSAPLITSIMDLLGVMLYVAIAKVIVF